MERWRRLVDNSKLDVWTLIQQAIASAAADYPEEFRERRHQIAETLFDRSLLRHHADDDSILICKAGESSPVQAAGMPASAGDAPVPSERLQLDDAATLSDELEAEAFVLRDLHSMKETLEDVDQPESGILEALKRLQYMDITVDNLKATGIGKSVRILKKHSSKTVQAFAKELMRRWKVVIDEWLLSVTNATTTAIADVPDSVEEEKYGVGLHAPPLDEGAFLETGNFDMDLSQLLNFTDGEDLRIIGSKGTLNSKESSQTDTLDHLCTFQSRSIWTEPDNHSRELTTADERCSTTRDAYQPLEMLDRDRTAFMGKAIHCAKAFTDVGLQDSKGIAEGAYQGRPCKESSTRQPIQDIVMLGRMMALSNRSDISLSNVSRDSVVTHANVEDCANTESKAATYNSESLVLGSNQVGIDQKLEIAKRKLHQGYARAENAKQRRTLKVLNLSDLPMAGQGGKTKIKSEPHKKQRSSSAYAGKLNAPVHN